MKQEIEELCDYLAKLQNGEIDADDALVALPTLAALRTPELEDLFGNLHHYIADADTRAKDAGYRDLQESEMRKLISRLRNGDIAEANRVTFLGRT